MTKPLAHLASPFRLGTMQLKNRMVLMAMGVNLAEENGSCGDRIVAFHERQAQGGAGLIILGSTGVSWPAGSNQPWQTSVASDEMIPGLKRLADACHQHGAKVAAQLHHGGLVSTEDRVAGRPVMAPSIPVEKAPGFINAFLSDELRMMYRPSPETVLQPMSREDIALLVADFAAAARRVQEAGLDGIEIHGGHGYILSSFLSPFFNNRDDEYGGSLENRARLLLEVFSAVRAAVGADFPVWVKIDSGEFGQTEGITLEDAKATAGMLERAGADAITVSAYHDTSNGSNHSESNIPHTPERMVSNAIAIKQTLRVPVLTSGRIEPEAADKHIAAGHFDLFGMGRKMLADPDLPNKVCTGELDQIRPCVYCYCCVSQIYILKPVKCAVNAETAHERQRAVIATDAPRHYAVVGGGPAGMEAARRLASAGHRVTLLEAADRLGGTLQFASIAYEPNEHLLNWLRRQMASSAVDVRLSTVATAALLKSLQVDEVIVATGAKRLMPELPGSEQDFVFSGDEMRALVLGEHAPSLRRKTSAFTRGMTRLGALTRVNRHPWILRQASRLWLPLGQRIVVIGGELVGLELAEYLAHRGRQVTVVDEAPRSGAGLYVVRRMRLLDELRELGVTLQNNASEVSIGQNTVSYRNQRGQVRSLAADHVIVAQGATGDTSLADQLRGAGLSVHTVGDCNGVGYIEGAMESAAELVAAIGRAA
ncbi:MAG: FAD-dependent oxidoreductase [Haliea sp.]